MEIKRVALMAQLWESDISSGTISRALKKIKFTQKKKTYGYLEPDESKQQTFIEQLANQVDEMIVYVHEAGMDDRENYGYDPNERGQRF